MNAFTSFPEEWNRKTDLKHLIPVLNQLPSSSPFAPFDLHCLSLFHFSFLLLIFFHMILCLMLHTFSSFDQFVLSWETVLFSMVPAILLPSSLIYFLSSLDFLQSFSLDSFVLLLHFYLFHSFDNRIARIESTAFSSLSSLEWLYLHSNQLTSLSHESFYPLLDTLTVLDVHSKYRLTSDTILFEGTCNSCSICYSFQSLVIAFWLSFWCFLKFHAMSCLLSSWCNWLWRCCQVESNGAKCLPLLFTSCILDWILLHMFFLTLRTCYKRMTLASQNLNVFLQFPPFLFLLSRRSCKDRGRCHLFCSTSLNSRLSGKSFGCTFLWGNSNMKQQQKDSDFPECRMWGCFVVEVSVTFIPLCRRTGFVYTVVCA